MKKVLFQSTLFVLLTSCMPGGLKEEMNEGILHAEKMLADQEFKKAISMVELHKLRNGDYPNSLSELKFLTAMDSSIFSAVEYKRLDSVYELNLTFKFPSITGEGVKSVELQYPPGFWNGLGCVKSNVK